MVLFYLTNSALDITTGVLWWVTKNTVSGVYSGVSYLYGNNDNGNNDNENNDNGNNDYGNNDNGNNDKNDEKLRKQIEILSKSVNEINEQLKTLKNN